MPDSIGFFGYWHLALFGVLLPIGAWRSRRRLLADELPPRKAYFVSVIIQQLIFLGISIGVAVSLGIPVLGPWRFDLPVALASAGLLVGAVFTIRPRWEKQVAAGERQVHLVTPTDRTEYGLWAVISMLAGIGEEITYRGVLFAIVTALTGSPAASVVLCSLAFGAGHLVQGWQAAAAVVLFAAAFHLIVMASGSLHLAIIVHAGYDLIAGWTYGRLARSNSFMNDTSASTLFRGQAL